MLKSLRRRKFQCAVAVWIGALLLHCSFVLMFATRRLLGEEATKHAVLIEANPGRHTPLHVESEETFRQRQSSLYAFRQQMGHHRGPSHYEPNNTPLSKKRHPLIESQKLQITHNDTTFPAPIKLPFPIFVASLYKSGTTTIHSFFECGGQRSVHWKAADGSRTGKCLRENIIGGRKPFDGCGAYDVWTDNSFIRPPRICWDPSVSNLEEIYQAYPNATMLLAVRDSQKWTESVVHWGRLLTRLRQCNNLWPGQPSGRQLQIEDIRQFYLWQLQHVRDFAATHPSMTFLEVSLESEETGSILEERVGIPASCWGHHNKNDKKKGIGAAKMKSCREEGLDAKGCLALAS